jgi:hypothetical protein
LLGARLGAAACVDEASEGAKFVGDPTVIDVGLGSIKRPDDVLAGCADSDSEADADAVVEVDVSSVDDGGAAELAALELEACALVCGGGGGLALVAGAEGVAITGHSAAMPMSFWKTPMMLVSPTSTSLHTLLTTSPIFLSPATHASLHLAVDVGGVCGPTLRVLYSYVLEVGELDGGCGRGGGEDGEAEHCGAQRRMHLVVSCPKCVRRDVSIVGLGALRVVDVCWYQGGP